MCDYGTKGSNREKPWWLDRLKDEIRRDKEAEADRRIRDRERRRD